MRATVAWVFVSLALSGCYVVDRPAEDALPPTEWLGMETSAPTSSEAAYRVGVSRAPSREFRPDQLAELPVGAQCTVQLKDSQRVICGQVRQASNEILVLDNASELVSATTETGVPTTLHGVPYVNRLFRNVGTAREQRHLGTETISAFEIRSCTVDEPTSPAPRRPTGLTASAAKQTADMQIDSAELRSTTAGVKTAQRSDALERLNLSGARRASVRTPAASAQTTQANAPTHVASTVVAETFASTVADSEVKETNRSTTSPPNPATQPANATPTTGASKPAAPARSATE